MTVPLTKADWLAAVERNLAADKLFASATVLAGSRAPGAKLIIYPDIPGEGALDGPELEASVIADARELMRQETSATRWYGEVAVFIEIFSPRPKLVIVGGVHTAMPLAQVAGMLGFRTIIIDGRGRFATRERFPDVDDILVDWPDEALKKVIVDSSTYVVILTHDPKFDLPALQALEHRGARYVGAMGSRETRRQHMDQLRAQGVSEEFLKSVYGPVGLDLGARSAEEVALSIMAQIVAVRHGRQGAHLSDTG